MHNKKTNTNIQKLTLFFKGRETEEKAIYRIIHPKPNLLLVPTKKKRQ